MKENETPNQRFKDQEKLCWKMSLNKRPYKNK